MCLLNFFKKDQVVPLPCNLDHVFHIECLLSWADHNYTCPICRHPIIKSQSEISLYEVMHQRNQFNQHEDALASAVISQRNLDQDPNSQIEIEVLDSEARVQ